MKELFSYFILAVFLYFILSRVFDKFNLEQENFDPSLVPVSSIVTLAKVAQKLVNGNGTLTNPGNLQIGASSIAPGNLTVTGTTTIGGKLTIPTETWHKTSDNKDRLWFDSNGGTNYKSGNGNHVFRGTNTNNGIDIDGVKITGGNAENLTVPGEISSGKMKFNNGGNGDMIYLNDPGASGKDLKIKSEKGLVIIADNNLQVDRNIKVNNNTYIDNRGIQTTASEMLIKTRDGANVRIWDSPLYVDGMARFKGGATFDNVAVQVNNGLNVASGNNFCIGSICISESDLAILKNNVIPRMGDNSKINIGVDMLHNPFISTNNDGWIVLGNTNGWNESHY